MNHNGDLDEMQRERHSKIGSQMFVGMSFALLLNIALYSLGIRWLAHPSDTMAIVAACSGVYIIRLIMADAYQPPRIPAGKTILFTCVLAIIFAAILAFTLHRLPADAANDTPDYGAYILLGISVASLLGAGIASSIMKKRDSDDAGDER